MLAITWEINKEYFMKSDCTYGIYARVVDVSEIERVSATNEWDFWYKHSDCGYKALSMWYCVYYIHTETFVIFASLFISNLSKMLNLAATHREITTKSKYYPKTFVNKYLWGYIRIWGNPRIKSNVNSLFWMHNWKWMNLSKMAGLNDV